MKATKTPEERLAVKLACTAKWRAENVERQREYRKKYYAENREILRAKKLALRQQTRAQEAAYSREYYQRKRLERLAYAAAYRAANKALLQLRMQAWRDANKDIAHASQKAWLAKNPGISTVYTRERRARKSGNGGRLSRGIIKKLMALQDGRCAYCLADLTLGHHLDHKQPLSRGGRHTDENVHLTCPLCNMRKHNKTHEEFLALLQVRSA